MLNSQASLSDINVDCVKADPHRMAGGAPTDTFKKLRSIAACTRTTDWVFVIRDPVPEQRETHC